MNTDHSSATTFSGKNFAIAGASSGIGHALASQLLAAGATVYILGRREVPDLQALGATYIQQDFSTQVPVDIVGLPDTLHGVAYCPGSINLKPFGRLTSNDFQQDFQLNVLGAVGFLQATFKQLKKSGAGSVVLFSTVAVKLGMGFHASVAASKGALEGLGKSLAAEWAPSQIRVNVIAPSLTDTPLASQLLSTPEKRDASNKRHPLGRVGTADEVANAALWLLSPQSGWVTGQIIGIDGGMDSLK